MLPSDGGILADMHTHFTRKYQCVGNLILKCEFIKKEEWLYVNMAVLHSNNSQEAMSHCLQTDLILLKLQTTHTKLSRPALWCESLTQFLKKNKLIRGSLRDGAPSSVNISRRGHHAPFLGEM
jgi:hypothetical protein